MQNLYAAFQSLFEVNMGYRNGERILIFSDQIRQDESVTDADLDRRSRLLATAEGLASFASERFGNCSFVKFPSTAASGTEPPLPLWQATFGSRIVDKLTKEQLLEPLLGKNINHDQLELARAIVNADRDDVARVIIALSNNSTSHTNFRKLACLAGARFASLPHFDPEMFHSSMAVDWRALASRTAKLVELVNRGDRLQLSTPNGTEMTICKQGRIAEGDDGLLTFDGAFGNLPAGEVYLAPLEGKSQGRMVIEWGPTARLQSPLTLTVRDGVVTGIEGDDPLRARLEERFASNSNCRNLAELGIGTNDRASRPDNVLEAEKILGTIHLALGDNTGFGGTVAAPFHEDYVFYRPTLTLILPDGSTEPILKDGKLML